MTALIALTGVGKKIGMEGAKSYIQGKSGNGSNTKVSPAWAARQIALLKSELTFPSKLGLLGRVCCASGCGTCGVSSCWARFLTATRPVVPPCAGTHSPVSSQHLALSSYFGRFRWAERGLSRTGGAEEICIVVYFCERNALGTIRGQENRQDALLSVLLVYLLGCMQLQNTAIHSFVSTYMNRFLACTVFVFSLLPLLNIYISEVFLLCMNPGENIKPAGVLQ